MTYIEALGCLPAQFLVDTNGALLEADEANNSTPPGFFVCCD